MAETFLDMVRTNTLVVNDAETRRLNARTLDQIIKRVGDAEKLKQMSALAIEFSDEFFNGVMETSRRGGRFYTSRLVVEQADFVIRGSGKVATVDLDVEAYKLRLEEVRDARDSVALVCMNDDLRVRIDETVNLGMRSMLYPLVTNMVLGVSFL